MLVKLAKKKNRRQTESSLLALKNLFLDSILSNKKLLPFLQATEGIDSPDDDTLVQLYIDDHMHRLYLDVIVTIEDIIINDPLKPIKKKFMAMLLEMLVRRPEREEKLLEVLVNKLGDPDVDIANYTIKLLKDLQEVYINNP
jgi:ribosome biogenesis protein MAK21